MKNESDKTKPNNSDTENEKKNNLPGYPLYPVSDDIYSKSHEEKDINPENISSAKVPNETDENGLTNEKNPSDDFSGSDLDIPGSELDDAQEKIGSEDEENNSYSLGGDDHNDLDENPTT